MARDVDNLSPRRGEGLKQTLGGMATIYPHVQAIEGDADPRVGSACVVDGDVDLLFAFDGDGAVGDDGRRREMGGGRVLVMVVFLSQKVFRCAGWRWVWGDRRGGGVNPEEAGGKQEADFRPGETGVQRLGRAW